MSKYTVERVEREVKVSRYEIDALVREHLGVPEDSTVILSSSGATVFVTEVIEREFANDYSFRDEVHMDSDGNEHVIRDMPARYLMNCANRYPYNPVYKLELEFRVAAGVP